MQSKTSPKQLYDQLKHETRVRSTKKGDVRIGFLQNMHICLQISRLDGISCGELK